jgi:hypothetical protein
MKLGLVLSLTAPRRAAPVVAGYRDVLAVMLR